VLGTAEVEFSAGSVNVNEQDAHWCVTGEVVDETG
jgi:hypothetical protein